MDFLEDRIITRFGVPSKIVTNNAKAFCSAEMSAFCFKYGIVLSHASDYYPQGNGQAKSSKKKLMTIVKKIVGDNKKSWDSKIKHALWADRITKKASTGKSPFELVYSVEAPFEQWGLDFIGKFKDYSSNGFSWIITATYYFTKWVEAIPTKSTTEKVVMDFLEDRIITRFGVPSKIVTDNAKTFCSVEMS